ncbi:MAG: hypothetical protein AAGD05_16005 [Bacteroidota bacterium]
MTQTDDLFLVGTPGHTYGHASVLLKTDQGDLLFAGDVVFHQDQLLQDRFGGTNVSFKKAKATYGKIKQFAQHHPLIFLPSHDANAGNRLLKMDDLLTS